MAIYVDLSDIDLAVLIEQESQTARFGKAYGYGEGRTRKASCPWCGGTDRFAVVQSSPNQHFYCGIHGGSGCNKKGNAVDFMMLFHNIPFMEACKRLGKTPTNDGKPLEPHQGKVYANIDRIPVEQWRTTADFFLRHCQARLWHERIGKDARKILHQRGYTDEYIRERGYGLYTTTSFDKDKARWGITDESVKMVWLPRGIVIPWYVGNDLWKLNIRRPSEDLIEEKKRTGRDGNKYVNVKGGSNPIYRADTIIPGQPLVVFEGEFNADILAMVLRNAGVENVNVVATGSTGKGRADNWLAKIAKASPILISFDPDGAGAKAAKDYWHKVLPHALLWASRGGDLNDMYLAGGSDIVLKWLNKGLKIAAIDIAPIIEPAPSVQEPPPAAAARSDALVCSRCQTNQLDVSEEHALAFFYSDQGEVFCNEDCFQKSLQPVPVIPEQPTYHDLSLEEIGQRFAAASLVPVEIFLPKNEAEVKLRVEQEYRDALLNTHKSTGSQADYWAGVNRDLTRRFGLNRRTGPTPEMLARAAVPRAYPANFPRLGWVNVEGKKSLQVVGMHHAAPAVCLV